MQGLSKMLMIYEKIKTRINPEIEIGGIVITHYNNRRILNKDVLTTIQKHFNKKVFNTRIRENIALAEAPSAGKDFFNYNPNSHRANDYKDLCKEIIDRFN